MFPYSYRNTRETLGEREIEVGTRARRASVLLQFSQTFTSAIYNVWEHRGGGIFYYPYKITRAKLKRGNNSPYC